MKQWIILMFVSVQVKQELVSSRINFIHELSHELTNNLKLRKLGYIKKTKYQQNPKVGWRQSFVLSLASRNKTLVIAAKIYAETDTILFS